MLSNKTLFYPVNVKGEYNTKWAGRTGQEEKVGWFTFSFLQLCKRCSRLTAGRGSVISKLVPVRSVCITQGVLGGGSAYSAEN